MKVLAFVCILGSSTLALAAPENISGERQAQLTQLIAGSSVVKPYQDLAESKIPADKKDSMQGADLLVDCEKRPMSYGQDLAAGYCLFTSNMKYGWYADPYLVVTITGYIKKEKIQAGDIVVHTEQKGFKRGDYKDLTITSVEIQTPLVTGLE